MLRLFKEKKAQTSIGEYALTFFLVIGAIATMTIFVRRAIQARIYSAHKIIADTVETRAAGYKMAGNVFVEYEPYYTNTVMQRSMSASANAELMSSGVGTSGIFTKESSEESTVDSTSGVAAPSGESGAARVIGDNASVPPPNGD
ncbi:MAG: hypothetical protein P9X22_09285 [Candidatus Zapsychrus exili]|nr:hypothetical protein [Candidatus Zapsychrus exili]